MKLEANRTGCSPSSNGFADESIGPRFPRRGSIRRFFATARHSIQITKLRARKLFPKEKSVGFKQAVEGETAGNWRIIPRDEIQASGSVSA